MIRTLCISICCLAVVSPMIAQEWDRENPIADLTLDMSSVVRKLAKSQTGKDTQTTQKRVVERLDQLIAALEKQCEACRGGASGANPSRPLADSRIVGGPGGIGDLHAPKKSDKQWGTLPPKERERIMQSLTEGFPSSYKTVLERYYRRLAEEKPIDKNPAPPALPPKTLD